MKLLVIVASLLLLALIPVSQNPRADIVFKNGNVYTANDKSPRAEAIAVKADRICSSARMLTRRNWWARERALSI